MLFKRLWQSGQMQRTVNPPEYSYVGSNPTGRTKYKNNHVYDCFYIFTYHEKRISLNFFFFLYIKEFFFELSPKNFLNGSFVPNGIIHE